MSPNWYYQCFINIIFILREIFSLQMRVTIDVKIVCQWWNEKQMWNSSGSVTIHNVVKVVVEVSGIGWNSIGKGLGLWCVVVSISIFCFKMLCTRYKEKWCNESKKRNKGFAVILTEQSLKFNLILTSNFYSFFPNFAEPKQIKEFFFQKVKKQCKQNLLNSIAPPNIFL